MSIVQQEREWAMCEVCGLMIRRSASEDGQSTFIHHMPRIPSTQAGQEQLIAYYEKCPNLEKRLDVK